MSSWYGWAPYVPVAQRRAKALREMEKLRKKGKKIEPVVTKGRTIAETFWGQAWCRHLEKFSDYANRLPRGRTYVRNGSVCHLEIAEGAVGAVVSGSELYEVNVRIKKLPKNRWGDLKGRCTRGIGSLLELLQGRVSESVMQVVTDRDRGLFPHPREIDLDCSCPDYADMCKHVAAVLYGVGARLDDRPELLFQLRGVNPEELVLEGAVPEVAGRKGGRRIAEGDLSEMFGIDLAGKQPLLKRSKSPAGRPSVATGEAVAALRRKFSMSRSQFARVMGVSIPAVGMWEKKKGALSLQSRSLEAWSTVSRMSVDGAWGRLRELNGRF
jgi:DNA-binding transcriptional regulator YiaG